ncbi:MAG: phage holin family protein [Methanobrevibacter sp.]|jgi:hypothetical protein|nr:phage holin family protein [Methanobrevibacter sp.]
MSLDAFIQAQIVIGALGVGYILKSFTKLPNKFIPLILGVFGVAVGLLTIGVTYQGFLVGLISGLSSIGLNETFKQLIEKKVP